MKKPDLNQLFIYFGIIFLLAGLLLRSVDSFVLRPDTTKVLASWSGPSPNTAEGTVRKIVIDSTSPQHTITPAPWLAWASLSVGIILTAHGILQLRK